MIHQVLRTGIETRDAATEMIPPTEKLNLRQHVGSTPDLRVQEGKNLGREGTKVLRDREVGIEGTKAEIKVLRDREVGIEEIRAEAKVDKEKEEVGIEVKEGTKVEVEVDKETEEAGIEVLEKEGEKKVEKGKEVSAPSLKKKIKGQKLRVRKKKVMAKKRRRVKKVQHLPRKKMMC